mgnify:CR=1 FL=1
MRLLAPLPENRKARIAAGFGRPLPAAPGNGS